MSDVRTTFNAEKWVDAARRLRAPPPRTAEVDLAQCGGDMDRRAWQKAEEAEGAARDNFDTVVRMCVGDLLRGFPVLSKQ